MTHACRVSAFSKYFFSQVKNNKQLHKQSFIQDYQYFASIPMDQRMEQLARIMEEKRGDDFVYNTDFPQYPIQQKWTHKDIEHQTYFFQPKGSPKALIITYHGLNGHTGLSGKLAKALSQLGIVVAGYDYKNFGASGGNIKQRGLIKNYHQDLIEPSQQFMKYCMKKYEFNQTFVSGLSIGGAVAYQMALKNPNKVKGALLLSPGMKHNPRHAPIAKRFLMLAGIFLPPFQVPRFKNNQPKGLQQYKSKDNLLYKGKPWITTSFECLIMMRQNVKKWSQFKTPYLLIQSGNDKVLNPFQSIDFQNKCSSQDKTTIIIKDMWHSIYFEPRINDIIKISKEWLKQRI